MIHKARERAYVCTRSLIVFGNAFILTGATGRPPKVRGRISRSPACLSRSKVRRSLRVSVWLRSGTKPWPHDVGAVC